MKNKKEEILLKLKKEFGNDIKLSMKIRTGYKNFSDPEYYVRLAEEYEGARRRRCG